MFRAIASQLIFGKLSLFWHQQIRFIIGTIYSMQINKITGEIRFLKTIFTRTAAVIMKLEYEGVCEKSDLPPPKF
jgi:hypothetical protein